MNVVNLKPYLCRLICMVPYGSLQMYQFSFYSANTLEYLWCAHKADKPTKDNPKLGDFVWFFWISKLGFYSSIPFLSKHTTSMQGEKVKPQPC